MSLIFLLIYYHFSRSFVFFSFVALILHHWIGCLSHFHIYTLYLRLLLQHFHVIFSWRNYHATWNWHRLYQMFYMSGPRWRNKRNYGEFVLCNKSGIVAMLVGLRIGDGSFCFLGFMGYCTLIGASSLVYMLWRLIPSVPLHLQKFPFCCLSFICQGKCLL